MSLADDLLIVIEDQAELRVDRLTELLPQAPKQAALLNLGRLEQLGRVTRHPTNNGVAAYRLSPTGDRYLTLVLDALRLIEQPWDGRWFAILTTFSPNQRRSRDLFRHWLKQHGFGRINDGYWVSPWNQQSLIQEETRRLGIGTAVLVVELQPLGQASTRMIIERAWDLPKINRDLRDFLRSADDRLGQLMRTNQPKLPNDGRIRFRIQAKQFVFHLAKAAVRHPRIPLEGGSVGELHARLSELYSQARPLCYR